jgi:flavin prenyltransferase
VVVPCSVGSLGAIASGAHQHLIHRAADVTLKERRKLVLVVRETPLSPIHLRNMLTLAECGAVILPPMPAFYNDPRTIEDQVGHVVARILDQFALEAPDAKRWDGGLGAAARKSPKKPRD